MTRQLAVKDPAGYDPQHRQQREAFRARPAQLTEVVPATQSASPSNDRTNDAAQFCENWPGRNTFLGPFGAWHGL